MTAAESARRRNGQRFHGISFSVRVDRTRSLWHLPQITFIRPSSRICTISSFYLHSRTFKNGSAILRACKESRRFAPPSAKPVHDGGQRGQCGARLAQDGVPAGRRLRAPAFLSWATVAGKGGHTMQPPSRHAPLRAHSTPNRISRRRPKAIAGAASGKAASHGPCPSRSRRHRRRPSRWAECGAPCRRRALFISSRKWIARAAG
jgi:hypothetical protein